MLNQLAATRIAYVAVTLLCLAGAENSFANLLINGGFETPPLNPGDLITVSPGNEPTGLSWTVTSGTVDVGNLPVPFVDFPSFEGDNGPRPKRNQSWGTLSGFRNRSWAKIPLILRLH